MASEGPCVGVVLSSPLPGQRRTRCPTALPADCVHGKKAGPRIPGEAIPHVITQIRFRCDRTTSHTPGFPSGAIIGIPVRVSGQVALVNSSLLSRACPILGPVLSATILKELVRKRTKRALHSTETPALLCFRFDFFFSFYAFFNVRLERLSGRV